MPAVKVFPCPQCGEFIADDASRCRFCATPIDPTVMGAAVVAQDKANKQYMRSRYRRHMFRGAGICLLGLIISLGTLAAAYYSPTGGYFLLTWGLVIAGAGDFLYGLVGMLGLIK